MAPAYSKFHVNVSSYYYYFLLSSKPQPKDYLLHDYPLGHPSKKYSLLFLPSIVLVYMMWDAPHKKTQSVFIKKIFIYSYMFKL